MLPLARDFAKPEFGNDFSLQVRAVERPPHAAVLAMVAIVAEQDIFPGR